MYQQQAQNRIMNHEQGQSRSQAALQAGVQEHEARSRGEYIPSRAVSSSSSQAALQASIQEVELRSRGGRPQSRAEIRSASQSEFIDHESILPRLLPERPIRQSNFDFGKQIKQSGWFPSNPGRMKETFYRLKLNERKCFACPVLLKATEAIAAYTFPRGRMPWGITVNVFVLCHRCVSTLPNPDIPDISTGTPEMAIAYQNNAHDDLKHQSEEIKTVEKIISDLQLTKKELEKKKREVEEEISNLPKDIEKMQSHLEKLKKDSEFYKHKKEMQDLQEPAKNVSKILVEAGNKYKEICKMMSDINPQFERIDEVMANAKVEYQVDPLCKICSIPMDGFWCSQLCGHIFCKVCLERLHKQPCPTCRTPIGQLLKVHI